MMKRSDDAFFIIMGAGLGLATLFSFGMLLMCCAGGNEKVPNAATAAFASELSTCALQAKTLAESKICRAAVEKKYAPYIEDGGVE